MKVDSDGNLEWFVLYYDPIEQRAETFPHKVTAYSALAVLVYLRRDYFDVSRRQAVADTSHVVL